jgi:glycosyltransferase involved in cell wall biosynthesis
MLNPNEISSGDAVFVGIGFAKNEESTVGDAIDSLYEIKGMREVIVIDGGSSDNTVPTAREHGATIFTYEEAGKNGKTGDFLRFLGDRSKNPLNCDGCVLTDLDGTYLAKDAEILLRYIEANIADYVNGNRIGKIKPEARAMKGIHAFGNHLASTAFRVVNNITYRLDVLSGFNVCSEEVLRRVRLSDSIKHWPWGLEISLNSAVVSQGFRVISHPIHYMPRKEKDGSYSKLNLLQSYQIPLQFVWCSTTNLLRKSNDKICEAYTTFKNKIEL